MKKLLTIIALGLTTSLITKANEIIVQYDTIQYSIANVLRNKDFNDCSDNLNASVTIVTRKDGNITHEDRFDKRATIKISNKLLSLITYDKVNITASDINGDYGYIATLTSSDKKIKETTITFYVENNKITYIIFEK